MTRIGEAIARLDGTGKVTGAARYAADCNREGQLHAVFVSASQAAGRLTAVESDAASSLPGVVRILTHHDMPRFGTLSLPASQAFLPMQGDEIRHEGQPVAMVLAETLESAQAAAQATVVRIRAAEPVRPGGDSQVPELGFFANPISDRLDKGDAAAGMRIASQRIQRAYEQPSRHHNPVEPHAVVAEWQGEQLTLWDAVQHVQGRPPVIAAALGIEPAQIRVICQHCGGGFGTKGYVQPYEILAAAAARIVGRPVKLVLTRSQMYGQTGYQALVRHDLALGFATDHALTAINYTATNVTAIDEDFVELATHAARQMYAAPALRLRQRVERSHIQMPTPMRAPIEGPGTWALESAMDEAARQMKIDPLELRLASLATVRPMDDKPWSSNKQREAYEEGALRFGWRERQARPRRDGEWHIGYGMAACCMSTFRFPSSAEVILRNDGTALVSTGTQDIGTGTTTILPQIAAEVLGLPIENVSIHYGDTRLPVAGPTYGSSSTMGVGAAVMRAAQDARARLAELAGVEGDADTATLDVAASLRRLASADITGRGTFALPNGAAFEIGGDGTDRAMATFGAVFVEVGVDPELGLIRLRRAVGSYSVGRIVNPTTARSQMIGGMIWGWGMATMEQSIHEPTHGRFLHKNLSSVHLPVNADIPADLVVHFVDEVDEYASPIGGKGIGELGATGVAAAVANALFDATGKRVRSLPITPDKIVV